MARVLLVGKGPPERGGIPTFLQALVDGRLGAVHDIRFLNLTRRETTEGGRFSARDVWRTLVDARNVWRNSRDRDVVHVHTALAPLVTLLRGGLLAAAARARGRVVIVHAHGGLIQLWLTGRFTRLVTRVALAPATRIVVVSEGLRETLAKAVRPDRLVLVDNGVDAERFGPGGTAHDPPRILYVGLLTRRKGVLDLVAASELLRRRGVEHELWLAGGTTERGADDAADIVAAARTARLVGEQPYDQMPELYRSVDIFCLPSWWEAMPLSLLEAMAAGLPVVASRVGDVARAVDDGVTGLLVPPQDPQALASALEALLVDAERRRRFGAAGRERVRASFSAATTVDRLDGMYRELAAART
jgi:glycosyltransferase involved in cell wall biosynthesis